MQTDITVNRDMFVSIYKRLQTQCREADKLTEIAWQNLCKTIPGKRAETYNQYMQAVEHMEALYKISGSISKILYP